MAYQENFNAKGQGLAEEVPRWEELRGISKYITMLYVFKISSGTGGGAHSLACQI